MAQGHFYPIRMLVLDVVWDSSKYSKNYFILAGKSSQIE